ncbi:MAG: hypothetical protein HC938_12870, partial [Nitrospira sp.]|nr:hypothetical protein [Nitrospira sp.]
MECLVRIGFYQFHPQFGEVTTNLDVVTAKLEQADADLIVLPELFASGYQFTSQAEAQELAEPVPDGATVRRLVDLAKRRKMHSCLSTHCTPTPLVGAIFGLRLRSSTRVLSQARWRDWWFHGGPLQPRRLPCDREGP